MVATVRSLTSASSTSLYFRIDGGYYLPGESDKAARQAKLAEHRNASAWHGRGALDLGLDPGRQVATGTFETLLQGHVPGTDLRLGRLRDGQHEHRPGFDITFSAPKSVSLAALLPTEEHPRGDRAVQRAHDEAVRATLDWIEETLLETRGWDPATGRRPRIRAPWMVAATFRHIASRNHDPQLHTHAVVMNMTRDGQGRMKSVEPTQLRRGARLIGAYYRNELSRRLMERGYPIVPAMAGRVPSFEIAGYDRRVRDAFSTRRRQILDYMEEKGWDHHAAATQMAALATRRAKMEPLRAMLQTMWAERAHDAGLEVSVSRSRRSAPSTPVPSALEIVARAMRHLEERRSVFAEHELEALALGHSPGRHSIGAIRDAVGWLVRDGHLVEASLRGSDRAFVTDRTLKAERSLIAMMRAGNSAGEALAREREVAAHLADAALAEGQSEAVRTVLLARDRVVGVQGRAGTGKTTMLRHVRELAGDRPMLGLAPSAAAVGVLRRETEMPVRTLQWFLARCQAVGENGPAIDGLKERFGGAVLVLDEASMVSTDQMRSLMRIAGELDVARLVLVGDRSQLSAVEAGQPFRLLQQAGMTTAAMLDIRRQRSPDLRAAVQAVLAGDPREAVELIGSSVHEVPFEELGEKAAEAWLELDPETRERTLLVAPTHEMRERINDTVRDALAAEGALRGPALRIERLVSLGMTRTEKADVRNYRENDTIVFLQDQINYRVKADELLTVTGIEADRVLLLHPDGKPRSIRPQGSIRYRLEVYETRTIDIRAGDRIRWTRNDKARSLVNGEQAEVEAVGGGRARFRLADGRTLTLREADPQLRHLDHAWSSTVHGAQGATADGVIAVMDSGYGPLTDQSTFYVEISRARDSAVVLTDNREQLVEVLEANTGERATALEAVGERIAPAEKIVPMLSEKALVWSPGEEWAALEARARRQGTVPFRTEGYDALIERTRKLGRLPDLPAAVREVADGLHAYDRACREQAVAAGEFLGLLETHARQRRELEEAAGHRAVPELEGYAAWRDTAQRLSTNGEALLEGMADDDGRVAERLGQLSAVLASDESAIAEAEAGRRRDAEIADLRAETARLLDERPRLEARAGDEPPVGLDDYAAWSARCETASRRWRAMLDDPGTWRSHLDRLGDEAAEIAAALDRLAEHAGRDRAWARLSAMNHTLAETARDRNVLMFHLRGWEALVEEARALAERPGLPRPAMEEARRVLNRDRECREAQAAVEGFFGDAKEHRERWRALTEETQQRAGRNPDVSITDLPGYAPLSQFARNLRKTGEAIHGDEGAYGPHLDRIRNGRGRLASELRRLQRHDPLDRFADVTDRIAKAEVDARERNILPLHAAGYAEAMAQAERLAGERALEPAARRRLKAALDAHAPHAAQWAAIERLLQDMAALARQDGELEAQAAKERGARTLLPAWPAWRARNELFEEDAHSALRDQSLEGHWRSRPDTRERIEEGLELARERQRLPELEQELIAGMVRAEMARLCDPRVEAVFDTPWSGTTALVPGDRLRLRDEADGLEREAVVLRPGESGGLDPADFLVLAWLAPEPGLAPVAATEGFSSERLRTCNVHRADWSSETLREAEVARQFSAFTKAFPFDCAEDLTVGDLLRWTEIVEPEVSRKSRPLPVRARVVRFEGELIGISLDKNVPDDRCTVRVNWRSDGEPCEERTLSRRTLTARRCWRAAWVDPEQRESELDVQKRRFVEERRFVLRQGPHLYHRISP